MMPSSMTRAASGTGLFPVPSTSCPLEMIVVPGAVFMVEPSDGRWYHRESGNATRGMAMMFVVLLAMALVLGCQGMARADAEPARPRKVVLIAGPLDKSHPPGTHEYEKTVRLLKHCLDTSS